MKLSDHMLFAKAHLTRELRRRFRLRHLLERTHNVWDARNVEAMKLAGLCQALRVIRKHMDEEYDRLPGGKPKVYVNKITLHFDESVPPETRTQIVIDIKEKLGILGAIPNGDES